jgi:hypothetical protein
MDQFDPQIMGLMEGEVTGVTVTDPQPFVGGVGNRVVDPTKAFTLTIEWELFGQLVPLWLAACPATGTSRCTQSRSVAATRCGSGP